MFGIEMNEKTFSEMQLLFPGFGDDGFIPKPKGEFDIILQKVLPGFNPKAHNTRDFPDVILHQIFDSDGKTLADIKLVILSFIFGCYNCKVDLDFAKRMSFVLLRVSESYKPKNECNIINEKYLLWLSEMAVSYILLGTVFAYKKDYIAASYYFMRGLKTEAVNLNMPYCDFITYILEKLDDMPKSERTDSGYGFNEETPMGSIVGRTLNARLSEEIIAEMEGIDGEVIVAKLGRTRLFGHLVRLGSTSNSKSQMIDIYETYLIDKSYKLYKIQLFFNGYFTNGLTETIRIAKNFKLKENSYKLLYYTLVEDNDK